MKFQFFPRSHGITPQIQEVIDCFSKHDSEISSSKHTLPSNTVLATVCPSLEKIGFSVEKGKSRDAKINVPVLFGNNGAIDKSYCADAISADGKIVIEVEAGRATENNQYMKDIFQACMMFDVEYLVIAVRETYRTHQDFDLIYTFLETLYISNRG